MKHLCEDIRTALSMFDVCTETDGGARVATHCLYPSFSPVEVYVVRYGDGYKVHDAGGAHRSAWTHGRDDGLITRYLKKSCTRFKLELDGHVIVADVPDAAWLASAILTVANASADAANASVAHIVAAIEGALVDRIEERLHKTFLKKSVVREFVTRGNSGRENKFDFGVRNPNSESLLLIDAVSPHPNSVAHKYVAFADNVRPGVFKFAVHDRPIAAEDKALLLQVAEVVPYEALVLGAQRALKYDPLA